MISSASRGKLRDADIYATRPLWPLRAESVSAPHIGGRERRPASVAAPAQARRIAGRWLPELLAVFAILNIGDLVSTYIGLSGGMREGNPLMSALLTHYGFGALVFYKAVVIVAVALGIYVLRAFHLRIASATIWVCNALVLAVVVMNTVQYLALR